MAGFVLWFTGLSGSGKSTLAALVAAELRRRGVHVETLDGDEIRKNLSKGLGFSKEDRDANVRRLGFVARLIARSGGCAITAAISPYRDVRDEVRRGVERFCEVFCDCPLAVLAKRDPKGLYDKAMRGEIKNFTGVDDPYEAPESAEVHLRTDGEEPAVSAARILDRLAKLGFIGEPQALHASHLVPPYGGDLQLCMVSEREGELAGPELDGDAERVIAALALGLLSPLRGFMGSRELVKVRGERHLESGLPWPSPIRLPVGEPVAQTGTLGLHSRSGQRLASLDVLEVWDDQGQRCVAGEVRVERLPAWALGCRSVERVREELNARGSSVALPIIDLPNLGDEHLARAVLELGQHLVLLPLLGAEGGPELVAACEVLVQHYLDPSCVSIVPVPAPPGDRADWAGLLGIYAQNLGVSRLLVPEPWLGAATGAGPAALSGAALVTAVHACPVPYFDEAFGGFVSDDRAAATPAALAKGRELRPEVAALQRSPT